MIVGSVTGQVGDIINEAYAGAEGVGWGGAWEKWKYSLVDKNLKFRANSSGKAPSKNNRQ
ncbi:hypothetical protein SLEP1_g58390 [Rubroshorea leprosula]|uniref:Uncharacterized protein n=1 Tax=Rubroshorea leprosula TaxID=152421 RepID=A0AAV5MQC7_9ROSI|nr:hypothetical protein SLEP1_g58390 [Rubroshorea leprosula]